MVCVSAVVDEDDVFVESDEGDADMHEYTLSVWRSEFCPVAKQLLERIESHQSDFETLEQPS